MNFRITTLVLLFFCYENITTQVNSFQEKEISTSTKGLKTFNFNQLETYLESKDSKKTFVVNFWATWCAPCVKELPCFEELNSSYSNQNVEVILVSLDFPQQIEKKLIPFLEKNHLRSEVVVLDDVDSNTWIPKVSEDWSGAIPATVIYNKNRSTFYERSFNYQELEIELKQFIN